MKKHSLTPSGIQILDLLITRAKPILQPSILGLVAIIFGGLNHHLEAILEPSPLVDMVLLDLGDMAAGRLLIELLDREIFPASLNACRCSGVEFLFRMIGGRKSAKTLLLASLTRSASSTFSAFFCPSAMLDMMASHLPGGRCFRDSRKME